MIFRSRVESRKLSFAFSPTYGIGGDAYGKNQDNVAEEVTESSFVFSVRLPVFKKCKDCVWMGICASGNCSVRSYRLMKRRIVPGLTSVSWNSRDRLSFSKCYS